jgi:two-component system phosphate regulon response regulator OmpR
MSAGDQKKHLLVVDDDTRIRDLLVSYLNENGFLVSSAGDAKEARKKMRSLVYDLIILDIMMPGETGLDLSRSLRAEKDTVPILFLSALSDTDNRIEGLMAGGDDYLGKPFEPRELLLRVASILRRQPEEQEVSETVSFGPYVFHLQRGELRRDDMIVHLTTREKEMLRVLASSAGDVVARQDLTQTGGGENTRGVDVQITRLRGKIEDNPSVPVYLQTVRARGYVLHVD